MAVRVRIDRRLAAAPAPVPTSEGGAIVVFRDRWGEVEQQFEMAASGLPAPLIGLFAEAFRGHYASAATASRDTCWKAQRIFARYLASLARSVSVTRTHVMRGGGSTSAAS